MIGKCPFSLICVIITVMFLPVCCPAQNSSDSPVRDPSPIQPVNDFIPHLNPVPVPVTTEPYSDFAAHFLATELLTRPTNHSVMVSLVPREDLEISFTYGTISDSYQNQTPVTYAAAHSPVNVTLSGLLPDTKYYYRTRYRTPGSSGYSEGPEHTFQTQRSPGDTFTFGVQADSHPERVNKMFDDALYQQTLQNAATVQPDFYLTLGDDFSLDPLIGKNQLSSQNVDAVYLNQRTYLDQVGSSSPLFLVTGNHEQASRYLLDGTSHNAAVYAISSRMKFFPQPVPDGFYTGDTGEERFVGLPGDYYAWVWGDALFVVIDPYWHTPVAVDNEIGKMKAKNRDFWEITLGEIQYRWLKDTLDQSTARYKFVFSHHVLGTGRGGIELANTFEWGGKDQNGAWAFDIRRPGWEMPIQQIMAENNVTIFFQGHDHLFARQELDGVTYQEVPCPADPTYSMFNADAYTSGTKLPNSGYLRVMVSPDKVQVDYVMSYLPGKETASEKNGMVAYSYTLPVTSS